MERGKTGTVVRVYTIKTLKSERKIYIAFEIHIYKFFNHFTFPYLDYKIL